MAPSCAHSGREGFSDLRKIVHAASFAGNLRHYPFETATVWSRVLPLYRDRQRSILDAFRRETGHEGYLGCHISHLYDTGACLYFTVGVRASEGAAPSEMNEQYAAIKASASEAFVRNGGTLSHHHGVGYEHEPWMDRDHSEPAPRGFDHLKDALDPKGIMSPGNLRRPSPSQAV